MRRGADIRRWWGVGLPPYAKPSEAQGDGTAISSLPTDLGRLPSEWDTLHVVGHTDDSGLIVWRRILRQDTTSPRTFLVVVAHAQQMETYPVDPGGRHALGDWSGVGYTLVLGIRGRLRMPRGTISPRCGLSPAYVAPGRPLRSAWSRATIHAELSILAGGSLSPPSQPQ